MKLRIVPLSLTKAKGIIRDHHRHHKPPVGGFFAVGVESIEERRVVGCAVIGRPVAHQNDDGHTAEVTRLCVEEGYHGAASMLLGASRRAAGALGYSRLLTFTLPSEGGASLRAAGWRHTGSTKPSGFHRRPGRVVDSLGTKDRWEAPL